jgi:ABC-type polysaccharide transport system permease subunit
MNQEKTSGEKFSGILYVAARVIALLAVCSMFFSAFNPAYVFTKVGGSNLINSTSLFTAAVSGNSIRTSVIRAAIDKGVLDGGPFTLLRCASIIMLVGIVVAGASACMSVGNKRMKHLANKILMGGAILVIVGALMTIAFYNGADDMIHETKHEGNAYSVSMENEKDKTAFTVNGKTLTLDDVDDSDTYAITIKNETGSDMTGWALEITVGEGYDVSKILNVDQWANLIKRKPYGYKYNYSVQGDKLVITPDNYKLTEEGLVQEGESETPEAANMPAGQMKITLVAEGLSPDMEIIVTDGTQDVQNEYHFPWAVYMYITIGALLLLIGLACEFMIGRTPAGQSYGMETKYQLFIMFLPFLILIFAFSYLPLYGWRYAFFEEGTTFKASEFVGFKWFTTLFATAEFRARFFRVMTNTLAMSALGLLTSWVPMAFAIFLNEIKNTRFRRFVQTFSTIPNFISWVLVYAIAFSIFATDGLINNLLGTHTEFLTDNSHLWLKMLLWGTWKGVGWSAIIYISGIAGIDQQLYEAASIDGADRFQRMWHITLPGLMPTYIVMLVMSIAGILSNGMDQYLVFTNASTKEPLEVLDLYTYNLGIGSGQIALSTVVGMGKSIISIVLFFIANTAAKKIRGNGIV